MTEKNRTLEIIYYRFYTKVSTWVIVFATWICSARLLFLVCTSFCPSIAELNFIFDSTIWILLASLSQRFILLAIVFMWIWWCGFSFVERWELLLREAKLRNECTERTMLSMMRSPKRLYMSGRHAAIKATADSTSDQKTKRVTTTKKNELIS